METDASLEDLEACRLCANFYINATDVDFVHLFKPQESLETQITFIRSILEFWQLQVLPDDGLPQRICASCFSKFCNIYTLREECIDAQTRLLDAILTENMTGQSLCINEETSGGLNSFFAEELLEMQNAHMQTSDLDQMQLLNNLTDLLTTDDTNQQVEQIEAQTIPDNLNNIQTTTINATTPMADQNNMDNFDLEDMLLSNVIHKQQNNNQNNNNNDDDDDDDNDDNNGLDTSKNGFENKDDSSDSECEDEEELIGRVMTNPLACQYCHCPASGSKDYLIFSDCEALSQHFFDIHNPKRPYNCPECPRTYQTMRKREDHVRTYHKQRVKENDQHNDGNNNIESNVLQCIYCFEKVHGSMELHEFNCNYVGDWKCNQCNEQFLNTPLHRFRTHERIHNPNKQLFCRLCNRDFRRPATLATHEKMHFSKKYTCELCNEGFISEHLLKRHKYDAHDGEMPVHCNICNKAFASFSIFQRHQNQYHPENQQVSNCQNCGKKFNSELQLQNHVEKPKDENGKCVDSLSSSSSLMSLSPPSKRTRYKQALEATHNSPEVPLQSQVPTIRDLNVEVNQQHFVYRTKDIQEQIIDVNGENTAPANIMQNPVHYLNMLTLPDLSGNSTQMTTTTTDNGKNILVPMPELSTYYQANDDHYFLDTMIDAENEIII